MPSTGQVLQHVQRVAKNMAGGLLFTVPHIVRMAMRENLAGARMEHRLMQVAHGEHDTLDQYAECNERQHRQARGRGLSSGTRHPSMVFDGSTGVSNCPHPGRAFREAAHRLHACVRGAAYA